MEGFGIGFPSSGIKRTISYVISSSLAHRITLAFFTPPAFLRIYQQATGYLSQDCRRDDLAQEIISRPHACGRKKPCTARAEHFEFIQLLIIEDGRSGCSNPAAFPVNSHTEGNRSSVETSKSVSILSGKPWRVIADLPLLRLGHALRCQMD